MDSALAGSGVLDHLQSEHWLSEPAADSEVELGASPVAAGSVVSDFVVGSVTDPVGQRAVLLDLFGQFCLLADAGLRSVQ